MNDSLNRVGMCVFLGIGKPPVMSKILLYRTTKLTIWSKKVTLILKNHKTTWYIEVPDDMSNKICKLHQTLKIFCCGKSDPFSVEITFKLFYPSCLPAYKAKYRECMTWFASVMSLHPSNVYNKHLDNSKKKDSVRVVIHMSQLITNHLLQLLFLK